MEEGKKPMVIETLRAVEKPQLLVYRVTLENETGKWEETWGTTVLLAEFIRGFTASCASVAVSRLQDARPEISAASRTTSSKVTAYFVSFSLAGQTVVEEVFGSAESQLAFLKGLEVGFHFAGYGSVQAR